MPDTFSVYDVSTDSIMTVTKAISTAASSLSFSDIARAFEGKYKEGSLKLILTASVQLQLLTKEAETYTANIKYRDNIKRAQKEELIAFFREALQSYPPFLVYVDFVSKGYSSLEAATMTRGIMRIGANQMTVEKAFRNWGTASGLMLHRGDRFEIPMAEKGLPAHYVRDLLTALDSELKAKVFLIDTLTPEIYNYIVSLDMDISGLSTSLLEYEARPKPSLDTASQFFETFLHKFGAEIGVSLQGLTGVNALVKELHDSSKILTNQKNLGNGLGGFRNIAVHGVDSETQKAWQVTPQAAIAGVILIPTVIKSYYMFIKKNMQEI